LILIVGFCFCLLLSFVCMCSAIVDELSAAIVEQAQ
jgi:hypothetical protein